MSILQFKLINLKILNKYSIIYSCCQGGTNMNVRSRDEILINTAIKLIKREAIPNLRNIIAKTHTADIALIIKNRRTDEKPIIFDLLKDEVRAGEVLTELDTEDKRLFIESVPEERLEKILQAMSADDVTNFI